MAGMFTEQLSELAYYLDLVEYAAPPAEGYANDALAAAIASAQANQRPLVLAPGTYRVNVTANGSIFVITQPLRLYGMPGARIEMYHDGDRQNLPSFHYNLFRVELGDASGVVAFVDMHLTGPSINGAERSFYNAGSVAVQHNCIGEVRLERTRIDGEFKYAVQPAATSGDGLMSLQNCRLNAECQTIIPNVQAGSYVVRDRDSIFENVWLSDILPHHLYGNGIEAFDFGGSIFRNCDYPIVGTGAPPYAIFHNCLFEDSCGSIETMAGGMPTILDGCIFQDGSGVRGEGDLLLHDCTFHGAAGLTVGNNLSGPTVWRLDGCSFESDAMFDAVSLQKDEILLLIADCYFRGTRIHVWNEDDLILRGTTFDNRSEITNCAIALRNAGASLDARDVSFLGPFSAGPIFNPESAPVTLVDCLERP